MTRLAHIQGGTEKARYAYADVGAFVKDVLARPNELSDRYGAIGYEEFVDDEVDFLLSGISSALYPVILVSTNATIQPVVGDAFRRHADEVDRYLREGGGIVLMPQEAGGIPDPIAERLGLRQQRSVAADGALATSPDADDVLLNYPLPWSGSVSSERMEALSQRPLHQYVFRIEDPTLAKTVLVTGNTGAALVRSTDGAPIRAVVSSIPIDWMEEFELLRNALSYALNGRPLAVYLRGNQPDLDGLAMSTVDPSVVDVDPSSLTVGEAWALTAANGVIRGPGSESAPDSRSEIAERGFVIRVRKGNAGSSLHYEVEPGNRGQRELVRQMRALLDADTQWGLDTSPFNRKSLVSCAMHIEGLDRDGEILITRAKRDALLAEPNDAGEDFYNRLAQMKVRLLLGERASDSELKGLERARTKSDADTEYLIEIVQALHDHPDGADLGAFVEPEAVPSLAALARILDGVATLDLVDGFSVSAEDAAVLAATVVEKLPPPDSKGWGSNEGTTAIVRGLCALAGMMEAPSSQHLSAIAQGVVILDDSLQRRPLEERPTHEAARVVEALLRAQRTLPLGLNELVGLLLPGTPAARSEAQNGSLIARLQVENRRLHEDVTLLASSESAARTGRSVVTSVLAVLAALLIVVVVALVSSRPSLEAFVAFAAGIVTLGGVWYGLLRLASQKHCLTPSVERFAGNLPGISKEPPADSA